MHFHNAGGSFPPLLYMQAWTKLMCFNKMLCLDKHEKWERSRKFRIRKGEENFSGLDVSELDYFRSSYEITRKNLVNHEEVMDVIKNGWVVDAQPNKIVILGYVKQLSRYVPVHVQLNNMGDTWYIRNAYYPTTEEWGVSFDNRICFCIKTDNGRGMVG